MRSQFDDACPKCDCADWGMMGHLSTCAVQKYLDRDKEEDRRKLRSELGKEASRKALDDYTLELAKRFGIPEQLALEVCRESAETE